MRIGILTLMHGYNYGGVLQCFSLCRTLEQMGHTVEVINYHPNPRWRMVRRLMNLPGRRIGRVIERKISERKYGRELDRKFSAFRDKHLNLSEQCNTENALRRLSENYDALMVGSDQVWNLNWYTPEYFLSFAQGFSGLKVSYAACFGHGNQPVQHQRQVGNWLASFDLLTVRNAMSQAMVKRLCGRDSQIVADPTLLCDVNDLAVKPEIPYDKYILLYALSKKRYDRLWPVFANLRDRLGLPIVAVKSGILQAWAMPQMDYQVCNPGVEQWLALFSGASFVLTDSFHGTLFAVKNRVPFINYIGHDKSMERVVDIVERYALHSGYPADPLDTVEQKFDFDHIGKKVETHVAESLAFLQAF